MACFAPNPGGAPVQGMYLVISPNPQYGFGTVINTNQPYFNFKIGDGGGANSLRYKTDNKDSFFTSNLYDYTAQNLGDGTRNPGKALELYLLRNKGYSKTPGEDGTTDSTEWYRVYPKAGHSGADLAEHLYNLSELFHGTNFCQVQGFADWEEMLGDVASTV